MFKKIPGILICVAGAILMLMGIIGLINAFDVFSSLVLSAESMGYAFGSIVIPLLFAVFGRWIWRKGVKYLKTK